jgi:hypothetical protein
VIAKALISRNLKIMEGFLFFLKKGLARRKPGCSFCALPEAAARSEA